MKSLRMMRNISCALIITDGECVLLVNPTNHSFWEPPKGIYDFDEDLDFSDGAKRECFEETGLDFRKDSKSKFVGVFDYNKKKDLAVTIQYVADDFFEDLNMDALKCTSTFNLNGTPTPEIQGYKIATWEVAFRSVLPHMEMILRDVLHYFFPEADVEVPF